MADNELWGDDPGWVRENILPLEFQGSLDKGRSPGGEIRLAVPGVIRNAVNDLYYTFTEPAKVLTGADTNPDPWRMASTLATGGMSLPTLPENALGMFAGVGARTADKAALGKALTMEGRNRSPEEILQATGWFRGPDRKWRFEIPDTNVGWKGPTQTQYEGNGYQKTWTKLRSNDEPKRLEDVLHHPEFFKAYPDLANTQIARLSDQEIQQGTRGAFSPGQNGLPAKIELMNAPVDDITSYLLHESQHGIQNIENFARGGNQEEFMPADYSAMVDSHNREAQFFEDMMLVHGINPAKAISAASKSMIGTPLSEDETEAFNQLSKYSGLHRDVMDHLANGINLASMPVRAHQQYRDLAGEVEARAVQERHALGDFTTPVWKMPGYTPTEKQLVLYNRNPASLIPVVHNPFEHSLEPVSHNPFETETPVKQESFKGWHGTPHTFEPVEHNPFGEFSDDGRNGERLEEP